VHTKHALCHNLSRALTPAATGRWHAPHELSAGLGGGSAAIGFGVGAGAAAGAGAGAAGVGDAAGALGNGTGLPQPQQNLEPGTSLTPQLGQNTRAAVGAAAGATAGATTGAVTGVETTGIVATGAGFAVGVATAGDVGVAGVLTGDAVDATGLGGAALMPSNLKNLAPDAKASSRTAAKCDS